MEKKFNDTKRDLSLQGLRGIAIISIVISHMFPRYNMLGGFGAALFVALSGFIACKGKLTGDGQISRTSVIYRILKLYPLYFIVTCITAIYFNPTIVYGATRQESILAFVLNILMLQTYLPKSLYFGAFSQVGWYMPFVALSIICTPVIIKIWKRLGVKGAYIYMVLLGIVEYLIIFTGWKCTNWLIYFFPLCRLLEFIAGGCVYIICADATLNGNGIKSNIIRAIPVTLVALAGCLFAYVTNNKMYMRILWWFLPTWALLASCVLGNKARKILGGRYLTYIGDISFEIFLTHLMIIKAVESIFLLCGLPDIVAKAVSLVAIVIIGALINKADMGWKGYLYKKLYVR